MEAKYKIDLLLGSGFSLRKPSVGMISLWESGRALHGDGDTKLYVCPGDGCAAVLHTYNQGVDHAICTECGKRWKSEQLIGEVAYRLEVRHWAEVLERWYRRLDMNADIRMIYPPDDIRSLSAIEQSTQRGGDLLEPARARRATRAYPNRNLIRDTSSGADLQSRFLAFLRA